MTQTSSTRRTRAERMAMPLARQVVRDLAVDNGACIRPIQLRRTDLDTRAIEQVLVPCGHTLASVCPACAERAKTCGRPSAGKAGTWTPNRSSTRTRRPRTRSGGSKSAPKPRRCATTPPMRARTPRTWTR